METPLGLRRRPWFSDVKARSWGYGFAQAGTACDLRAGVACARRPECGNRRSESRERAAHHVFLIEFRSGMSQVMQTIPRLFVPRADGVGARAIGPVALVGQQKPAI